MDETRLKKLLRAVERGDVSAGEALKHLEGGSFDDIGFAKLDLHREARCGVPEAIFCQGKTVAQIQAIARRMRGRGMNLLATRASEPVHRAIAKFAPDAVYCAAARTVTVKRTKHPLPPGEILIVCAGTADIPVAEEARVTAEFLDNRVRTIYDVGVAGLHRLLRFRKELRRANVVIVVAGMEGALASVVGGMVARPVIAVPTSIGYGASFSGIAPLLTMLNSCAAGVAVVNIDNGFGAGSVASLINHTGQDHAKVHRPA
jgi:pyridinium-3,5-biscarboxylic acid mononucleotide synthase